MLTNVSKFLLSLLFLAPCIGNAQTNAVSDGNANNMVKFNVLPLFGGKFAFEYERMLTDRISVGASLSLRPEQGVPFQSLMENIIDDDDVNNLIVDLKSSNVSFTPEVRFYMADRGAFKGFYLAPFLKYTSYGASVPYDFEVNVDYEGTEVYRRTETIPLDADLSAFTAGLSVGINYQLTDKIYLDWRIIGPGFGFASGDVSGNLDLNAEEQLALRESLEDLKTDLNDLPLSIKIDYDVRADGASIDVKKSPWANIRSGLSVGYRF